MSDFNGFNWMKAVAKMALGLVDFEDCVFTQLNCGEYRIAYCYASELNSLRLFHWFITAGFVNSETVGFNRDIDSEGNRTFSVWIRW